MYFGPPPQQIVAELFATVPDHMRTGPGGKRLGFLEGPSFDRAGNLLCVDVQAGRVYRISPAWRLGNPRRVRRHPERPEAASRRPGLHRRPQERPDGPGPRHRQNRNPALRPRRGSALQRPERPAFRGQRRSVFHRPGPHRAAGSDRLRLSPVGDRQPGLHHRQRAKPERPGAEQARERALPRRDAGQCDLAHRARRSRAPRRPVHATLRRRSRRHRAR